MQEAAPTGGGMAAILGLSNEQVEEACRLASELGVVAPANYKLSGTSGYFWGNVGPRPCHRGR